MKLNSTLSLFFLFSIVLSIFSSCTKNTIDLVYTPYKDYGYVHVDYQDEATVYSLNYSEPIKSAEIRPYSKNIKSTINNGKVEFSLPQAGHYVAYINGFKVLIFAQEIEQVPTGDKIVNAVTDLNIDNSGKINQTDNILKAIDSIAGSGKTLFFPKGEYLTSQLKIRDKKDVDIYIEKGAVILADTTTIDFRVESIFGKPAASSIIGKDVWGISRGFIIIDKCENLNIRGYGMINGQGRCIRRNAVVLNDDEEEGRFKNFIITRSNNILLEDIISADSGEWNTHILGSKNVSCVRVKLMNELKYTPVKGNLNLTSRSNINTDGFDIDASTNVLIKDCFGYCADDNIAIKSTEHSGILCNVDSVTIEGCVFLTQKSSLKVGTETGAVYMKNIVFRNNDVIESDRGISVYCYDGAEVQAVYDNNRIEENLQDARQALVSIEVKPRHPESKVGKADIQIRNTSALMQFPQRSHIIYEGNDSNDLKVVFENLTVAGERITQVENDIFEYQGNPSVSFE